ncbi:MAG: endonuclease III domain-containing protein [Candidatus Micrarchaeia archaeon]
MKTAVFLENFYEKLYRAYGPQGWWPLLGYKGTNPTKTGSVKGYHPGDYSIPRSGGERFEICVGAILTQNTSWVQVEKALQNLKKLGALSPGKILQTNRAKLAGAIRPAGYFNQKAKKLKIFSEFYLKLGSRAPSREELLSVWGVGPETADSMLLYAFKVPTFVVDAYTKRILGRMGLVGKNAPYGEVKALFEKNLPPNLEKYQEFHALLVEHAKRRCNSRNPLCGGCLERRACKKQGV